MCLFCSIASAKVQTIFDTAKNNFHNHTERQRGRTAKPQTLQASPPPAPDQGALRGCIPNNGISRSIQGAFTDKMHHIDGARK